MSPPQSHVKVALLTLLLLMSFANIISSTPLPHDLDDSRLTLHHVAKRDQVYHLQPRHQDGKVKGIVKRDNQQNKSGPQHCWSSKPKQQSNGYNGSHANQGGSRHDSYSSKSNAQQTTTTTTTQTKSNNANNKNNKTNYNNKQQQSGAGSYGGGGGGGGQLPGVTKVLGGGKGDQATFFFQNGVAGACGTVHADSVLLVALTPSFYDNGKHCGKSVFIKNTSNGKTVIAVVADLCPSCQTSASLDLSTGAFDRIGLRDTGVLPIIWGFLN